MVCFVLFFLSFVKDENNFQDAVIVYYTGGYSHILS